MHIVEVQMTSPKIRPENSDKPRVRGRQASKTENPVGLRILDAMEAPGAPRIRASLALLAGLPESTIGDAIERGPKKIDVAIRLARALNVDLEWLLTGVMRGDRSTYQQDADDESWVHLPRYDLRQLTETSKGLAVERVPIRRDWLNRRLHVSSGLWLTEVPSDYEAIGLLEGDAVICSDIVRGDGPQENWICIFLGLAGPYVGRFSNRRPAETMGDTVVSAVELGSGEVHPIARIHARLLAKL
ncbi:helix-turn-helix domain-containing protein [Sphingomonas sp. AOB5]|uniref:helix-turn-helix domain-containing protein n=1 Tax=Sphingomonas sp. AOB5 TaxID=3034017 RepID=UPI0023F72640|nr:helix-turn-helix domain-containing protein [Sphingomonas sp. AOB5]MDF7777345.1 helix-turn-helix domain-containing protein [Sphingomonas sp. AOB5]